MASSASISQALREGEALAATAPPEMTLDLSLEQSSQRSVVKRIKVPGHFLEEVLHASACVCVCVCTWMCLCVWVPVHACMRVCVCA